MDALVDRPDRLPNTFTMNLDGPNDLARVRARLADAAAGLGLSGTRIDEFSVALSEIATNALRHGSGAATITVTSGDTSLIAEVRDQGTGLTGTPPSALPQHSQTSGRGLWLARQLCDDLDIASSPSGTTVRITMRL
jgi:anti-sigma regulatory factor (Ser/Thr protein kinase)